MLRHLLVGMGLLLAGILFGVPLWIAANRADLAIVNDADLVAVQPPPVPDQNGFEQLEAAAQAMQGLLDDGVDERLRAVLLRRAADPEFVASLMRRNATAFAALEGGLSRPEIQLPDMKAGGVLEETDFLLSLQQLVKLSAASAQQQLESGDRAGAFDRALLGMRLGHSLSEARGAYLHSMVFAVSYQGISLAEIERLLRQTSLDSEAGRALIARIGSEGLPPAGWKQAYAAEYRFTKSELQGWPKEDVITAALPAPGEDLGAVDRVHQWLPEDYVYQPNRSLDQLAAFYRVQQLAVALDCRQAAVSELPDPPSNDRPLSILFAPNSSGRELIESASSIVQLLSWRRCQLETRIALVQTLIAIRAFRQAHGDLPERLDELVPTYLDAVPIDRFDGSPLRYSRSDGIAYSVGKDLRDAGGAVPPSQGEIMEPTIDVAF